MKRGLIVCFVLFVFLAGCAQLSPQVDTPEKRLAALKLDVAAAVNTLSDLRVQGDLSDTQAIRADRWIHITKQRLDEADEDPTMSNLELARDGLLALREIIRSVENE